MRAKLVTYWMTTGLLALTCIAGGAIDVARPPGAVAFLTHLGFPAYVSVLLGAWKVLGGLALIAPRLPRLKEWAYAGIFFDVTGAAFSHASVGDPAGNVIVPLLLAAVTIASWSLRPDDRKLTARHFIAAAA